MATSAGTTPPAVHTAALRRVVEAAVRLRDSGAPAAGFHKCSYITLKSLAAVGHYCTISFLQRIAIRFFGQPTK